MRIYLHLQINDILLINRRTGEENTKRAGEVFVKLATDNYQKEIVTLASKACVGIASVY